MADEPQAEGAEAPKKGSKAKVLILMLVVGLVLGGGGLGAYLFLAGGHTAEAASHDDTHAPKTESPQPAARGKIVSLKGIVVNLRDTNGTRYLKVVIGLETVSDEVVEELNEIKVPLNDFLIDRLSNLKVSDIDHSAGRNKLKRELLLGTNDLLKKGVVTKLYFSEFVIQ